MMLIVVEACTLFAVVAGTIFAWAHPAPIDSHGVMTVLGQAAALSLSCIVAFYYNDLYDLRIVRSFSEFGSRLLQSFGVALILLAGFYTLFPDTRIAGGRFASSLLMVVGVLLPLRAIGYAVMRWRAFADRVLILGTGKLAHTLIPEIEMRPHHRYTIVGVVDEGGSSEGPPFRYPLLGPLEHLDKIIEEITPDRIIVALAERRGRMPMRQLLNAEAQGILVEDGLTTYENFTGKLAIEALTPSFLIFSGAFRKSRLLLAVRRLISLGTAVIGLILTAPLMALVAIVTKLDSPGPVFFIDDRAGRAGQPFRLIKFRTMRAQTSDPDGHEYSVWSRDDRDRVTRVGRWIRKFRLDELPQFWNILKGDMDLVGPRPEIIRNVKTMTEQIPYYSLRHVVRPGLTGWAQVRYGYSVSLEQVTEKMRHDLFYIKHMSLWLDLRIIADTVKIGLFGRGAQ